MSPHLTVDVVTDIRTLVTVEPAWWSLWHRSRVATPFQSPAWLIPWWRAFAPGELFVVVVWHKGRLLGLAPLYVDAAFGNMRLLPLGISISDYVDILADGAWERAVLEALGSFLATCPTLWNVCELPDLPGDALALRLPCPAGCDESVTRSSACPVLALADDDNAFELAVPPRKRRDIRMARHRAERRGGIAIARADGNSAGGAVENLFRLHRARWENRGQPGVLADPRLHRFHGEAVPKLVEAGLARLYTLEIGGTVAGVYYGLADPDRAYAYLCGFDPAFDHESPGTILIAHAIEESVRERVTEFHFLRGREGYKYRWGAVDRWNYRRTLTRTASRARAS
ncbi:MAG: GNAT family N-acetyltransferase [Gemmatimonas sp.]